MTGNEMVGCHHWLNGHEFPKARRFPKRHEMSPRKEALVAGKEEEA